MGEGGFLLGGAFGEDLSFVCLDGIQRGADTVHHVARLGRADQRINPFGICRIAEIAQDHRRHLALPVRDLLLQRSEEHTYELQSLMRNSYAVFCLKKKNKTKIAIDNVPTPYHK